MHRNQFTSTVQKILTLILVSVIYTPAFANDRAPNIVVILLDDLGYADVGCYGARDIQTPHIDSIAERGVRFTSGYVTASLCSPSRAGILTGRYPQSFSHVHNLQSSFQEYRPSRGLPKGIDTLADRLKQIGYATGAIGKWDLGLAENHHPNRRGFDEFFGFLYGASNYLTMDSQGFAELLAGAKSIDRTRHQAHVRVDAWITKHNCLVEYDLDAKKGARLERNGQDVQVANYLTDAFSDEAVGFIHRHRDVPFFLYLPYNAPHVPLQAPKRDLSSISDRQVRDIKYGDWHQYHQEKRRTYAAMVEAVDRGIGRILSALQEELLDKNTLIFFLSDNGGSLDSSSDNSPFSGGKGWVQEGGIRVPFIASWPNVLPTELTYDEPVSAMDIASTALAAAGAPSEAFAKLDGVNLIPYILNRMPGSPHEALYWHGQGNAVRIANWKLILPDGGEARLYDLANDVEEQHDLAPENPQQVEKMKAIFQEWEGKLPPPGWADPRAN